MAGIDKSLEHTFPQVSLQTWQQEVIAALRGGTLESLTRSLPGGLDVAPLYTTRPSQPPPPGLPPFTRGGRPGWRLCQRHAQPQREALAEAIAEDLAGGVEVIGLRLDRAARLGAAPTAQTAGQDGAPLYTVGDLQAVLPAGTAVWLEGGGVPGAALVLALLTSRQEADAPVWLGLDPLGTLASDGALPAALARCWDQAAALVAHCQAHHPAARALRIATAPYHQAGATAGRELGIAAAALVETLRALEGRGLSIEHIAASIELSLPMGRDVFANIARLRALRTLYSHVLTACGAAHLPPPEVHAHSAARTLTAVDPWVNMLRVTTHTFSAIAGGADLITAAPFDGVRGPPSALGRRIARNTPIILRHECHLDAVQDPAGGSYYVEALTAELIAAGWAELQRIEADGGLAQALCSGALADALARDHAQRSDDIARRRAPIIGVSAFPDLDLPPVASPPPAADRAVRLPPPGPAPADATLPALVAAAAAGASLSRLAEALVAGPPLRRPPLPAHRDAEDFEALRARVRTWMAAGHARPAVRLACLGHRAAWIARATFATHLLAAGGIAVRDDPGTADAPPEAAAAQLAARCAGAPVVCICGTDRAYATHGPALVAALSGHLALAGRPPLAGVSTFLHRGCDAIAVLSSLLDTLGVRR